MVDGVNPPEGYDGIVTIDLTRLDQVLEIDDIVARGAHSGGRVGPGP